LATKESRKLQLTARGGYIISVPKRWVEWLGLKAGMELSVVPEEDLSLRIVPKTVLDKETSKETTLTSAGESLTSLARKIIGLYLVGYSVIRIIPTTGTELTPGMRESIKTVVRHKLVGTEVIADSSQEMVLRVLLSYPELAVEDALRRMAIIANSMHKDSIKALRFGNPELARQVINTDDEVDRFGFYIVRLLKIAVNRPQILKDIGLANPRDCLGYRLITKSVERVADHSQRIAEMVMMFKGSLGSGISKQFQSMSDFSTSLFEDSLAALFKRSYELADSVLEKHPRVDEMQESLSRMILRQSLETEQVSNLRLILESLRRTAEYSSDIAEIVINLIIERMQQPGEPLQSRH